MTRNVIAGAMLLLAMLVPAMLVPAMLVPAMLLPALALAQTPVASISVALPQRYMYTSDRLQLSATVLDQFGGTLPGDGLQWQSQNPQVASVDSAGLVTGSGWGVATIVVTDPNSGLAANAAISVYPASITLAPSPASIEAGSSQAFTATAFDAKGKQMAVTQWKWMSSVTSVATVDDGGRVAAVQPGAVTISAYLDAGVPDYNAGAAIPVTVRRHPSYKVTRIAANDSQAVSIRGISAVSHSSNDKYSFTATLSNGGTGLGVYDRGVVSVLLASGRYVSAVDRVAGRIVNSSINAAGDVAALVSFPAVWCEQAILLFHAGTISVVQQGCISGFDERSLNDLGDVVWLNGSTILTSRNGATPTTVAGPGTNLPGIGAASYINRAVATVGGGVLFSAGGPTGSGMVYWDRTTFQKVATLADKVSGDAINSFEFAREGAAGDFYFKSGAAQCSIVLWRKGNLSYIAKAGNAFGGISRMVWFDSVFDAQPQGLALMGDTSTGKALISKATGSAVAVATVASTKVVAAAWVSQKNTLSALALDTKGLLQLLDYSAATPQTMVKLGVLGDQQAGGIGWDSLLRGFDPGNLLVRGAGEAIVKLSGNTFQTQVAVGDTSGSIALTDLWASTSSRDGAVAFYGANAGSQALFVLRNQKMTQIAAADGVYKLAGNTLNWFPTLRTSPLSMNRKGQIVTYTSAGTANRLALFNETSSAGSFLYSEGAVVSGSGPIFSILGSALDDNGKVLFYGGSSKGTMIAYWDGQTARKILETGDKLNGTGPAWRGVNWVLGAGSQVYADLFFDDGTEQWAAYDGTRWSSKVKVGDALGFGGTLGSFPGSPASANSAGDIAYVALDPADTWLVAVRRAAGTDSLVASGNEQTPDGDWLTGIYGASISESGTVYFTASAWRDGKLLYGLYEAIPQQ